MDWFPGWFYVEEILNKTGEKIFLFCVMNAKYIIHIRAGDLLDISSVFYIILYWEETAQEI